MKIQKITNTRLLPTRIKRIIDSNPQHYIDIFREWYNDYQTNNATSNSNR